MFHAGNPVLHPTVERDSGLCPGVWPVFGSLERYHHASSWICNMAGEDKLKYFMVLEEPSLSCTLITNSS